MKALNFPLNLSRFSFSKSTFSFTKAGLSLATLSLLACSSTADVGTRKDREALYNYLYEKTMEREAFTAIKNRKMNINIEADMAAMKADILAADTPEKLYYTLWRFSNLRKDSHLSVRPVKGAMKLSFPEQANQLSLPVKFYFEPIDQVASQAKLFISDVSRDDLSKIKGGEKVAAGDYVEKINGLTVDRYIESIKPYFRYSTELGFWGRAMRTLHQNSRILPPEFYGESMRLDLVRQDGSEYTVSLPYLDKDTLHWSAGADKKYPEFTRVLDKTSFDFYVHNTQKLVLFDWYGFRGDLVKAMDEVMVYAEKHQLLEHDIIWDGSTSRGGGRGAYAIQRLSPKAFKTTFGNVRISDVIPKFMAEKKKEYEAAGLSDGTAETVGDGDKWQMEWWEDDVTKAINAGQAYTNNVPFKLAHAPKWSDGMMYPAKTHFKGDMVCILGPKGGSHLDQFASIVKDNHLCTLIGMPSGGYSNTWEWRETLKMPTTGKPLMSYMWDIGHTIRPNGEILEGNPALMDEFIPSTAKNYTGYHAQLIKRAEVLLSHD